MFQITEIIKKAKSLNLVRYRHSSYNAVLLYRGIPSNAVFSKPKTALKFYLTRFFHRESNKINLNIDLNGKKYPVLCEPGEEQRVINSSKEVNKVINELSAVSESIGETRLLAMTCLLLADKLIDKSEVIESENFQIKTNLNSQQVIELVNWIEKVTIRMNNVASLLEKN